MIGRAAVNPEKLMDVVDQALCEAKSVDCNRVGKPAYLRWWRSRGTRSDSNMMGLM
jgi:hypothetical protein